MLGFSPTKLTSTWFTPDETQWPQGSYCRNLFGQALLFHPYIGPSNDTATPSERTTTDDDSRSGDGRFIDEMILETIYRHQGDIILDDLLEILHQEGRPIGDAQDLLALASLTLSQSERDKDHSRGDQALADFVHYTSTIPSWVNWDQVERGQAVFLAYAPSIGASLFYRSLVPGFSIPKIAAVLQATAYLAPPATREHVSKRLLDTGAFVAAILADMSTTTVGQTTSHSDTNSSNCSRKQATQDPIRPRILAPYSVAWTMALQVRVLHAKVRRRLLQRKTGSVWNVHAYGVPINQEDLAATLLGFSYNAMMGSEMILGRPWPVAERLDFLAFWRYVGWLLGVQTKNCDTATNDPTTRDPIRSTNAANLWPPLDPCGPGWYDHRPDPLAHAYAMFGSILLHLSKPDATSVVIAHHLLRLGKAPDLPSTATISYHEANKKSTNNPVAKTVDWWFYFRSYQCRRFAGHALGDALCLPYHPKWYQRVQIQLVSSCYLWMLRLYSWAAWPTSPLRKWIVCFHQRQFTKLLAAWSANHASSSIDSDLSSTSVALNSCPFAMVRPPQ